MEYQYWVVQDWNTSVAKKCGMTIGEYYESVVKHLPSTERTGENAFEPVKLDLRLSRDVCVPLSVAVTDDKWYERLQQIVTDTYFRRQVQDPSQVKFVDVTRKDIRGLSGNQLATCGKIRAFLGDKEWLQSEDKVPPTALRTDKQTQLASWFDRKAKERIIQATVQQLQNSSQLEIVTKTKVDGPLDLQIRAILKETVPGGVSNVMSTFGCTEKTRAVSADTAIGKASETILRYIRQGLRANQTTIERTINARIASSMTSEKDSEEGPMFSSMAQVDEHTAAQEQKLFTHVTRKALNNGVINIINHFYRGIGCHACQKKTEKKKENEEDDGSYYSDYYYGDVNKRFVEKYHAVAGRAIFMEPKSDLQGLRGARLRKKIGEPVKPKLVPIESPMRPGLEPIGNHCKTKKKHHDEDDDDDDRPLIHFVDEDIGEPLRPGLDFIKGTKKTDLPRLVPIGNDHPNDHLKPRLVPIGNDHSRDHLKPKLVPISNHHSRDDLKPPLIPVKNTRVMPRVQRVNDGLPDILDFLKRRK